MIGELASLSAAACWAVASILWARLGRLHHPVALNLIKCTLSSLLLMATLWLLEGTPWPMGLGIADGLLLALSGLAGLGIGDSAYFSALVRLGARRALLVSTLTPGMTALVAWPVLGEPVHIRMVLGMGLTLSGVLWVAQERLPEDRGGNSGKSLRVGFALAGVAALGQTAANILIKMGGADVGALAASVVRLSAGSFGIGIALGMTRGVLKSFQPLGDRKSRPTILFATVLGTYLGIWLSVVGLLNADVGVASTLISTSPLFVLPLAWWMDGERASGRAWLGAGIAVLGVVVLVLGSNV